MTRKQKADIFGGIIKGAAELGNPTTNSIHDQKETIMEAETIDYVQECYRLQQEIDYARDLNNIYAKAMQLALSFRTEVITNSNLRTSLEDRVDTVTHQRHRLEKMEADNQQLAASLIGAEQKITFLNTHIEELAPKLGRPKGSTNKKK